VLGEECCVRGVPGQGLAPVRGAGAAARPGPQSPPGRRRSAHYASPHSSGRRPGRPFGSLPRG
jgi:hypothetical protein